MATWSEACLGTVLLVMVTGCAPNIKELMEMRAEYDREPALGFQAMLVEQTRTLSDAELQDLQLEQLRHKEKLKTVDSSAEKLELKQKIVDGKTRQKQLAALLDHLESVSDEQADLLEYFIKKQKEPVWRAEMMKTMGFIDQRYRLATNDAANHRNLVSQLKREYKSPNAKRMSGSDKQRLRAYAVYTSGHLDGPTDMSFYYEILETNSIQTDADYAVRVATLNSLHPELDAITRSPKDRQRLLALLGSLSAELSQEQRIRQSDNPINAVLSFFESRLKTYPFIVELLPTTSTTDLPDDSLNQVLEWNYQQLKTDRHTGKANAGIYRDNIHRLCQVSWHSTPAIRNRARLILVEFEPTALLSAITERLENRKSQCLAEDFEQAAGLLPLTDKLMAKQTTASEDRAGAEAAKRSYEAVRTRALRALFARLSQISLDSREKIYSVLCKHDPEALGHYLATANRQVMGESPVLVLQHIRYLGRLVEMQSPGQSDLYPLLTTSLARCGTLTPVPIRQQIVARLLPTETLLLATHLMPSQASCQRETPETASYLLDAYLSCLTRLEEDAEAGKRRLSESTIKAFGDHPHAALTHFVARPEIDLEYRIAKFLTPRDPDLLITLLADRLLWEVEHSRPPAIAEYALLGDLAKGLQGTVTPATSALAMRAMRTGLTHKDEDTCLLASVYVVELGGEISTGEAARTNLSVKNLVRVLADEAKLSRLSK